MIRQTIILPNHWETPTKEAIKQMMQTSHNFRVHSLKINETLTSYNKLELDVEADANALIALGVYIGKNI